jgi:hypothetical protein
MRNTYKILVGKPGGKRPLGTHRCRWENNIKVDLRKILREAVDRIDLTQDRDLWWALVNTVMNVWVP